MHFQCHVMPLDLSHVHQYCNTIRTQGQPCLMQCPHNDHHFIAKSSVEKHKSKCRYGAVGVVTDEEIVSEKGTSKSTSVSISESATNHFAGNVIFVSLVL